MFDAIDVVLTPVGGPVGSANGKPNRTYLESVVSPDFKRFLWLYANIAKIFFEETMK